MSDQEIIEGNKMKKLRLIITKKCSRDCSGCCNKQYDLDSIPIVEHFNYDEILITGGEPLDRRNIVKTLDVIKGINTIFPKFRRKIYVYTAVASYPFILKYCDGVTLTLHTEKDVRTFLQHKSIWDSFSYKSLRLNVFEEVKLPKDIDLRKWDVKTNLKWIYNCPLPEDEVLMRLPNIE